MAGSLVLGLVPGLVLELVPVLAMVPGPGTSSQCKTHCQPPKSCQAHSACKT